MAAFSKNYHELVEVIMTDCTIYQPTPMHVGMPAPKSFHTENTAWDTGANVTYISPKVVKALGLKKCGKAHVDGSTGDREEDTYLVHIGLPDGSIIPDFEVIELTKMEYDVLIGMDIISLCDFCFTNKDDESIFSYRLPSTEHIELK